MPHFLPGTSRNVLITGGAGFIGSNLAAHLLATTDAEVILLDNLSRVGSDLNLEWLDTQARPGRLQFVRADVRDKAVLAQAAAKADEIYHFAARCPGVTCGPDDFDVNVTGTLNVLEAARRSGRKPMVLFASISEVYSNLRGLNVEPCGERYQPVDPQFCGIPETAPVQFRSAYECSIAAADRFVREAGRVHNLPTVVMRLDTIAGPRQFVGDEPEWVSNYVYSVLAGRAIRVDGNGLQVHDMLHVADLVEGMVAARAYLGKTAGKVYNLGGGMAHSISVNEMIKLIERVCYRKAQVEYLAATDGLRPLYVADNWSFLVDTGWMARRSVEQTVREIVSFWKAHQKSFEAPSLAQGNSVHVVADQISWHRAA